jgi:hypothetical protein
MDDRLIFAQTIGYPRFYDETISLENDKPSTSNLIDETTTTWKKDLVHACFLLMDAVIILCIPLCMRRQSDFWAWSFDRKGQFTIKLAYRMMSSIKR